ncbi:hypothetical protein IFR05_006474 [Cadophora sp. M221]|nr:hypothetical protein IFR05_006474 [Cadophora sp. M221]
MSIVEPWEEMSFEHIDLVQLQRTQKPIAEIEAKINGRLQDRGYYGEETAMFEGVRRSLGYRRLHCLCAFGTGDLWLNILRRYIEITAGLMGESRGFSGTVNVAQEIAYKYYLGVRIGNGVALESNFCA